MFDLHKLKDNNAIFWIFRFPELREAAAECGWALGVHGSVIHDLDLMAMPWVEEHTSADELAEKLAEVVDDQGREPVKSEPDEKPNGRIVYTIFASNTYIDLNVISYQSMIDKACKWLRLITNLEDNVIEELRNELKEYA